MSDLFSVKGKRILITGATSGIGLGGARALVNGGADVIISGRRESGQQIAEEIGARFIQCDVSDEQDVKRLIEEGAASFEGGKIDALFLNAGKSNTPETIVDLPFSEMRDLFKVNFDHCYAGIHYAVPYMAEYSSIAVTTSPAANNTTASYSAYSPSKAAAKMLCRAAAIELAPYKIRVNSFVPGAVMTEMQHPGKFDYGIVSQVICGEIRQPDEMGPFFVFMAADASRPMTGAEFVADDGMLAGFSLQAMTAITEACDVPVEGKEITALL